MTFYTIEIDGERFTIGRERGRPYEITGMFLVVHLILQFHVGTVATVATTVAVFDSRLYPVRYKFLGVDVQLTSTVALRLMQIEYVSFYSKIEVPSERIACLYQVISVMSVDTQEIFEGNVVYVEHVTIRKCRVGGHSIYAKIFVVIAGRARVIVFF